MHEKTHWMATHFLILAIKLNFLSFMISLSLLHDVNCHGWFVIICRNPNQRRRAN